MTLKSYGGSQLTLSRFKESIMAVMNMQVSKWTFTLFNFDTQFNYKTYLESEEFDIKRAVFGFENSRCQNKHIQGYVEFHRSYRFNHVRSVLATAHWQRAVGTAAQNFKYCTKSGVYECIGDWTADKHASDFNFTRIILKGLLSKYSPLVKCSKEYMSKRKDYDSAVKMLQHIKRQHANFDKYKNCKLSNWQFEVFKLLMSQDGRQVLWVVDITGNRGKSWFCFYMMAMYSYFICDGSIDIRDLCFTLPDDFNGILFDVCRNMEKTFNYNSLESVKNGYLVSGKYEGKIKQFNSVPTAVLSNFFPDLSKLSLDRWQIVELGEGDYLDANTVGKYKTQLIRPYVPPPIMPDLEKDLNILQFLQDNLNDEAYIVPQQQSHQARQQGKN